MPAQHQTTFETQRGISSVEVSRGHSLVIVTGIPEAEADEKRLFALRRLALAGLSIDFLKLSLDGFSFLVPEDDGAKAEEALCQAGLTARAVKNRAIITVKAPNIRDESGLVARVAELVVRSGASIDSVGDMHSSVLLVVDASVADNAVKSLETLIGKVDAV